MRQWRFAEWLAITHGEQGIGVSVLCPQGVRTAMLEQSDGATRALLDSNALDPKEVADAVIEGLEAEKFLILPHPDVLEYLRRKTADYDRWLRGMRRLQASVRETPEKVSD